MTVHEDYSLSKVLWYRIGGTARYFLEARNRQDIEEAVKFVKERNIKNVFVCGSGSNLIFSDDYFDGAVIMIARTVGTPDISVTDTTLTSFAGQTLDDVITQAFDHNLVGLEWAGGLPGTVGAAVRGNVGAFGGEIKDTLYQADVFDTNKQDFPLKTLSNPELEFVYRGSLIKKTKGLIVTCATFQLERANDAEVLRVAKETYLRNKDYRAEHHPLEYPNCGSVFKNIKDPEDVQKVLAVWPDIKEKVQNNWYGKVAMGYIISRLGLSGYRIGDAEVSHKHANFIVNLGHAKAADVRQIISEIQNRAQTTLGILPEVEVEIVG